MKRIGWLWAVLTGCLTAVTAQENSFSAAQWLQSNGCNASLRFTQYDYQYFSKPVLSVQKAFPFNGKDEIEFMNGRWMVSLKTSKPADRQDALDFEMHAKLISGTNPQTSVSVELNFNQWNRSNYVLMPAAAYNGNRFDARRISYSPKLLDVRDIGPDKPMIISDVPRLNINEGPSFIQERSGGMSVPAIGFHSDSLKKGFWLLTEQATEFGDTGFKIEESRNRKSATISLTVPVVRENYKYFITDNQVASTDRAPDFKSGDTFTLRFRVYFFPSENIQDIYNRFAAIRKDVSGKTAFIPFLPFSSCFEVQQNKFNQQNWVDEYGYYSVGLRKNFLQDWQIGWTGGMISTYPLLFAGNDTSRQHVMRNFDWLFPNGISPSGFFWDSGEKGTMWYGGDIRKPNTVNWHLVRKSGDGLYYIIKQFMLMKKQRIQVKPAWEAGALTVAEAFVKLWNKWGQFGNFIDSKSGDVVVGGSTSGAIVPAALVLAAQYFNKSEYLMTAKASAEYYYQNYIRKGITCGGPGDAMQNPDSESSYAMLESFMLLYEVTQDTLWLQCAEEMAAQFSTWVMAYDYTFPEQSTLGKLAVQTTGMVWANTQNKHGAPGICTHSGVALWRLYRATGNPWYMELLRDIAFVMPQYLSHPLRPIEKMNVGWMSERVSTTDWLEGIGELMYGSTWAETALMLSYVELPGIYVQPDKALVFVLDNVDSKIIQNKPKAITLLISNPTKADARVRLYVENTAQAKKPLGENVLYEAEFVELKPGEEKTMIIKKNID